MRLHPEKNPSTLLPGFGEESTAEEKKRAGGDADGQRKGQEP